MILQNPAKTGQRRASDPIHPHIQAIVLHCAAQLSAHHGELFQQDPGLKIRVSALLRRSLPPRPRRPGRPGLPNVTGAIRELAEITQESPELPNKYVWRKVYARVIPGWDAMSGDERREKQDWLRKRVRWRKRATRRRASQKRPGGKQKH